MPVDRCSELIHGQPETVGTGVGILFEQSLLGECVDESMCRALSHSESPRQFRDPEFSISLAEFFEKTCCVRDAGKRRVCALGSLLGVGHCSALRRIASVLRRMTSRSSTSSAATVVPVSAPARSRAAFGMALT